MLDLGANVECDADNLVQFAVMGDVFARTVLGVAQPTDRPAQCRLRGDEGPRGGARGGRDPARAHALPVQFHGFVEGDDIAAGTVDVVVTDGFTGNVALKTVEGHGEALRRVPARHVPQLARGRALGYLLARPALQTVCARGSIRGATTARSSSASTASA